MPMKFLSTVTKTIRHLGLAPLCPACSNCGWPVFHKNVQFRRDDVERSLNGERNLGFSLPRPYCRKCMNKLGVEAMRYGCDPSTVVSSVSAEGAPKVKAAKGG